jgi:histone-lysine N-methyltransferase SUV39H
VRIIRFSTLFYIFLNLKSLGTRYESIIFPDSALIKAHKVRWDDWNRADGTKTTWDNGNKVSTNPWDAVQRRIRQEKAATSLEIDVLHTTDIHNTLTYLRNQASSQMAKRLIKERQPNFLEEMNRNIAYHQQIGNLPASFTGYTSKSQRSSTRQKISLPSSSSSALLRSRSRLSMQSSMDTSSVASLKQESSPQSPPMRTPMKRNRKRIDSPDSDTSIGPSIRPCHRPASPTASQSRPVPVIERFETHAMRLVVSSPFLI